MTRVVRVKVLCEGCKGNRARKFCYVCRHPLCSTCAKESGDQDDYCREGHTTVRSRGFVTALAFCDMCDWRPASVYCEAEGSVLCPRCDAFIHSGIPAEAHHRKSISEAIENRPVSLVHEPSASESESVHDGSVVEPPTSPPSSPLVEPPMEEVFTPPKVVENAQISTSLSFNKSKAVAKKAKDTKRHVKDMEYENASGSGGNNNGSDERFDPASSKDASGDGVTNNGSNENGSNENGSNGDEGTSSVERTSVCASGDTRGNGNNGKGSSRDSCSSGAVSGNGANGGEKERKISGPPDLPPSVGELRIPRGKSDPSSAIADEDGERKPAKVARRATHHQFAQ